VSLDTACRLFMVGQPFAAFSLALAFPSTANTTMVQGLSTSMVRKQVSWCWVSGAGGGGVVGEGWGEGA
jgi:hypothetical protein